MGSRAGLWICILGANCVPTLRAATFPDCAVGAMPPFGNLYNLPVYVDRMLAEDATIVFQAGTHTDTISLAYVDFARLVKPAVVEFAYHPQDIPAYV